MADLRSPSRQDPLREVIAGRWSIDDLIEVSVAANVGSGPDRAIGGKKTEEDTLDRIFQEFSAYLKRTGKPPSADETHSYSQRRALPEYIERKLRNWIRGRA